jgi:hypothetical protein
MAKVTIAMHGGQVAEVNAFGTPGTKTVDGVTGIYDQRGDFQRGDFAA